MILLVAEMEDLKANPNKPARGTIIEAKLEKGKGPVATVIVQNGTLQIGDAILAGTVYGKVRAMFDDRGRRIKKQDLLCQWRFWAFLKYQKPEISS